MSFFPGGLLSPKSYVDVPGDTVPVDLETSDFHYIGLPIVLPNFPPISIPFSKEKHQILTKFGAFYNDLSKIHPIHVIWALLSLMKPPPRSLCQISRKSAPKGRHIYTVRPIGLPCQCENPPGFLPARWPMTVMNCRVTAERFPKWGQILKVKYGSAP